MPKKGIAMLHVNTQDIPAFVSSQPSVRSA